MHGDRTGHTLGFPTANLDPKLVATISKDGIYAGTVQYGDKEYLGAIYLGPRLTLGEVNRVFEIHLLDFSGDLYGQSLSFTIDTFIRPPKNFTTVAALKQQLADDISAVRRLAS